MLGINDTEARLKFIKRARALQRKKWSDAEIAEKLLGGTRFVRGVTKLTRSSYTAQLRLIQLQERGN